MPRDDARSQEKPKRPSLARRATSMLPSIRNPLDFDGDGVVSRSDFIPHFLDRDGDGHFAFADMSHDMRTNLYCACYCAHEQRRVFVTRKYT